MRFSFYPLFSNIITIFPFAPSLYCWTRTCSPGAFLWIQTKLRMRYKVLESQKEVFFLGSGLWTKPQVSNRVTCLLRGASYPEPVMLLHYCLSSGCLLIFRKSLSYWCIKVLEVWELSETCPKWICWTGDQRRGERVSGVFQVRYSRLKVPVESPQVRTPAEPK